MTQEEKAKAYDEALMRTQQRWECGDISREMLEYLFPQLQESEDERIRKAIIDYFNLQDDNTTYSFISKKDIINWLEKQGEQKLINKVEPKFNFRVGQWIVTTGKCIYLIAEIEGFNVTLVDNIGNEYVFDVSSLADAHLWTIQDAKDGDVLCYKDEIFIYKHDIKNCTEKETSFGGMVYYCCYDGKRFITDSMYSLTEKDKDDIHPATRELRDLLYTKMKEAGYELDAEKKELNGIEQMSAEWSEEDEKNFNNLIEGLTRISHNTFTSSTRTNYTFWAEIEWLKSLKQRMEEQR
ncbi:MAG: hypothetical protein J6S67_00225 [Methanobrevibacter sp.]|nr:hypothetical protein [Methanobrevibacter sp.]